MKCPYPDCGRDETAGLAPLSTWSPRAFQSLRALFGLDNAPKRQNAGGLVECIWCGRKSYVLKNERVQMPSHFAPRMRPAPTAPAAEDAEDKPVPVPDSDIDFPRPARKR